MNHNNELLACYKVLSLLELASENTENMIDNLPGVLVILNENLCVIRANEEFSSITGHTLEQILGFDFTSLFSIENKSILLQQIDILKNAQNIHPVVDFELEITPSARHQQTRQFYWQATLVSHKKTAEGLLFSISGKDLSELYESEMKLKSIFTNLPLGMLIVDADGKIKEVLSKFSEVLLNRHELVGEQFSWLIKEADQNRDASLVDGLNSFDSSFGQSKEKYLALEKTFPKLIAIGQPKKSNFRWLNIKYQPLLRNNKIDGFILLIEDVTESVNVKKEMVRVNALEQQIQTVYETAIRDPLSGLYTRLFMKDGLKSIISNFDRGNIGELAVLMMDVDHFKEINDTYGHGVGDRALSAIGAIILEQIRESDIAIRYGGEEFLIVLPSNMSNMTSANIVAERIRKKVEAFRLSVSDGKELKFTISGGAAWCQKSENIFEAIERADDFLYQAKRAGRNCIITESSNPGNIQ